MTCPVCGASAGAPALEGEDRLLGVPGRFTVAECTGCGLALTAPRLEGEALGAHYPDRYGQHVAGGGGWLSRLRRRQLDLGLRRAPFSIGRGRTGRMLDVGCGRGDHAAAFARAGWTACGLDFAPAAVAAARAQGVDAEVGEVESAPWPARSFDLVLFSHVVEHLPDPVRSLRAAGELVAPGGRIVVQVPDWGSRLRRWFGTYWFNLDLPRHLQHFDAAALRTAASSACGRGRRRTGC
jgi:SAM-dependent methyltransferase